MFSDDELLPISALQHFRYCERQCALIHLEQIWGDNRFTVEGTRLHRRVDEGEREARRDRIIVRTLPLRSDEYGITGRADVVEFLRVKERDSGVPLEGRSGLWKPQPVEYKRGRPKKHRADEIQLCAQGLCLEEMLGVCTDRGFLYYGANKRRTELLFDTELRDLTRGTIERLRHMRSTRASHHLPDMNPRNAILVHCGLSACQERGPGPGNMSTG